MFDEYEEIPAGLDAVAPGPVLGALLSSIDIASVSGHDQVTVLRAHQRMASHHHAQLYKAMAAVTDSLGDLGDVDPVWAGETAAAEIRAALVLTRRAADTELGFALDLDQRLPQVAELLASGAIDVRRARTIVHSTAHLPVATGREVVDRVIDDAPALTTGQLGAKLRRLCIDASSDDATDRYNHAVADRRVVTEPSPDGTAHLMALDLPPHRAAAATRRINQIARSLRGATETRTMDQLRADVLVDLLDGTAHTSHTSQSSSHGGVVDIRVDLATLTELADNAGDLAGYGPVVADIARAVVKDQPASEWRYTVTDGATGEVVTSGTTRRRPSASQRRTVETRHTACVFPGCRMPATRCDLDHQTPWAQGGETTTDNLTPLCRHDHRIRHQANWTHTPLPNGTHQWTTTLGHIYTTSGTPP